MIALQIPTAALTFICKVIFWGALIIRRKQPPIPSCSNCNYFQVIKCSFANYDPKEKGWNQGITSFSQLMGKHCSVTVVDVLQEEMMLSFAVDVVLPDFGKYLVVCVGGKTQNT